MAEELSDYQRHVQEQAAAIVRGIVREYHWICAFCHVDLWPEAEEIEQEWRESYGSFGITRHEDGSLEYEIGLAGPRMGSVNIWLEGKVSQHKENGATQVESVVCKWAAGGMVGQVIPDHPPALVSYVYEAIGSDLDDTLEWLRVPTVDCLEGKHSWGDWQKVWLDRKVRYCKICDAEDHPAEQVA